MSNKRGLVPTGIELELDLVSAGIQQVFQPSTIVVVDGVSYTFPDLQKVVEGFRRPHKELRTGRMAVRQMLQEVRESEEPARKFLKDLRHAIFGQLGSTNPELEKFGFKPERKPAELTAAESVAKAEKARLTREARHTLGSKQKEAIHGTPPAAKPTPPSNERGA